MSYKLKTFLQPCIEILKHNKCRFEIWRKEATNFRSLRIESAPFDTSKYFISHRVLKLSLHYSDYGKKNEFDELLYGDYAILKFFIECATITMEPVYTDNIEFNIRELKIIAMAYKHSDRCRDCDICHSVELSIVIEKFKSVLKVQIEEIRKDPCYQRM